MDRQDASGTPNLNEYLVCYDYGQGGIWYRMLAPSAEVVHQAFPHFIVFEREPEWWRGANRDQENSIPLHRVGDQPDQLLANLSKEAAKRGALGEIRS